MSLLSTFTPDQRQILQKFIERVIKQEKMINEIQKLIFDQNFYARFLKTHKFDVNNATTQMKNYLDWRKKQSIDTILDFEFKQFQKIKELCPNGFHGVDKEGRPIFIIQVGQIKFMELMSVLHNHTDLLVHFFIKELEHTWRVKFLESKEMYLKSKKDVDQIQVIIDMKGSKLKDLTNKQMIQVYKQLTLEVQRFFPELVHQIHIINSPMFFENVWESELCQCVDEETMNKVFISSSGTSDELQEDIDDEELPAIYGGSCECQATCIYSEKGPWSDCENLINFKEPNKIDYRKGGEFTEDPRQGQLNNLFGGMNIKSKNMNKNQEEFKMLEDDDEDQIDLLAQKQSSQNLNEFYEQNEQLEDLKNQIRMNVPGMNSLPGNPQMGHSSTNNNTEVGDTEASEQQAYQLAQIQKFSSSVKHQINFK